MSADTVGMERNLRLYPWFKFFQSLIFWQAVWFLFFQSRLSGAEAILLYVVYDIATVALEVPSGYLSDRAGRRLTLIVSASVAVIGTALLVIGGGFLIYAAGMACLGAASAFASGTDSSLLFESLERTGQADDVETHEVRAWRAGFTALALSAASGGVMAAWDPALPFIASLGPAIAALVLTIALSDGGTPQASADDTASTLSSDLRRWILHPVLAWCFVLAVAMYSFSHVPFVFGQPFILEALADRGLSGDAPLVSGAIVSAMMLVSVATSWGAPALRKSVGQGGILLIALAMQIGLIAVLAASNHIAVISLLLLRMVPDSLSTPFLLARIQPFLEDRGRATYLSLQSFCGRLLFSASLIVLSTDTSDTGQLSYPETQAILIWYLGAGLLVLAILAATSRAVSGHASAKPRASGSTAED